DQEQGHAQQPEQDKWQTPWAVRGFCGIHPANILGAEKAGEHEPAGEGGQQAMNQVEGLPAFGQLTEPEQAADEHGQGGEFKDQEVLVKAFTVVHGRSVHAPVAWPDYWHSVAILLAWECLYSR